MPDLNTTVKFEPTEKFGKLLEEAKADFKRIHTELTDDMKVLIAAEVSQQLAKLKDELKRDVLNDLNQQVHVRTGLPRRMETK